jgi:hypothetical protein
MYQKQQVTADQAAELLIGQGYTPTSAHELLSTAHTASKLPGEYTPAAIYDVAAINASDAPRRAMRGGATIPRLTGHPCDKNK